MKRRYLMAVCLAASIALAGPVNAAEDLNRAQAESRLEQLRTEISNISDSLAVDRARLDEEQEALKTADLEIQESVLAVRELEQDRHEHRRKLAGLEAEQQEYLDSLDQRRQVLAQQILTAYQLGRESRLKLVLNQDSPALLSRTLAYFDYLSRAQTSQIQELRQVLQTLDRMQAGINTELQRLQTVQAEQQAVLEELTQQRNERRVIVETLAARIGSDENRLAELERDRRDLEVLLEKLRDVLSDIPADLGRRLGPGDLKGQLPLPVKGRVRYAFGQARTAGLRWQGWLIGAQAGSEVMTVAHGRVAYSDWLRGYGLLMIIDHGDGYMSLYGNNESLLHEVGDWVEAGATISTVGSNPLSGDGLYFEIRKDGKAMDPAVWIKR